MPAMSQQAKTTIQLHKNLKLLGGLGPLFPLKKKNEVRE